MASDKETFFIWTDFTEYPLIGRAAVSEGSKKPRVSKDGFLPLEFPLQFVERDIPVDPTAVEGGGATHRFVGYMPLVQLSILRSIMVRVCAFAVVPAGRILSSYEEAVMKTRGADSGLVLAGNAGASPIEP